MINSLSIFSFITVIFGGLKYITREQSTIQSILTFVYVLMVIGMQFYISFDYIKQKCGGKGDYASAFFNSMLPFLLIFMVVFLMLRSFPSWKLPFSNTFGYLLTRLFGVKKLLIEDILKSSDPSMSKSLAMIYEDPSLLINALTPQNMREFTANSTALFKKGAETNFKQLYDFIIMKDIVAEYIWYFLTGILVTAYSISNIASMKCNVSASEMVKLHRLHVQNHKTTIEENDPSKKTIYTITE